MAYFIILFSCLKHGDKKKYKKILINMQKVCNFIHNNDIIISRKRWFRILKMEVSTCIGGISLEGCKV